ncbi:MAG UNVERIFIED_CONTAM: hypothetical protein LVR18_01590 [Planctomycetaceae bacterium]
MSKESGHDGGTASDVAGSDQTGLADCGYRSFAGLKRGQSGDVACCAVAVTGSNGQLLGLRGAKVMAAGETEMPSSVGAFAARRGSPSRIHCSRVAASGPSGSKRRPPPWGTRPVGLVKSRLSSGRPETHAVHDLPW